MTQTVKDSGDDILPRMTPASVLENWKDAGTLEKARIGVCVGGGDPLVNKIDKNACPHGAYVLEGESGRHVSKYSVGLPWWLSGKESACQAGDSGSIPGLGRSPGEGNGNPLQYSCLENPMDRGAWRATVHRVAKSWTRLK